MYISGFKSYLMLEKGLSSNTLEAYIADVTKLSAWASEEGNDKGATDIAYKDLATFVVWINQLGLGPKSQARIISGIRAFYKYMVMENLIQDDPSDLLEGPRLRRKIPDVLSQQEIADAIESIDLSHPQGHRNRAILETLYACGLRVSELVTLRLSCLLYTSPSPRD